MSADLPGNADVPAGLHAAQAAARLAEEGPNQLPGSAPRRFWQILLDVVSEPMFLMLLAAGAIYLLLGDRAEAVFLLGFVAVVIAITLAQERRTERALDALRDLSAPRACVVRDGREQRISGQAVVRGDLLVLHEGDRVAADAVLLRGQLEVDESLLSGESVAVDKQPGDEDQDLPLPGAPRSPGVFAGTVVVRGTALARVRATGIGTAVGRIGQTLATASAPPSGLQLASRELVRVLTLSALGLAAALVALDFWWDRHSLLESVLAGIALAMAILPEEIPVILTVFLALGALRIAHDRVLTRRMSAVEALGAVTVLAVDKTGTLTCNRMAVARLHDGQAAFEAGCGQALPESFHRLLEFAALATPTDPFDPTEQAIQACARQLLSGTEHLHDDTADFEYPLSPEIMAMTRVYSRLQPGRQLLACKGAPEAVADLCHLDAAHWAPWREEVERMADQGLRVLGVASGSWRADATSALPGSQHDHEFHFLGLLGLADPPRPEVAAAVMQARAAGIRVLMLTGDHPATARAIARQVGLSERPTVLTGGELAGLDDAALRERLVHCDLCARLQPEQKLRLVQVLQAAGEVVAMTGDGVNDAPALKAAHIGIAMGARGTDVAREAAALVLLDDSFASIVGAIAQGRRIYDNIGKATRFVFAVHVPIVLLALAPVILHWPALLLPVHIVLLELLIDPACSVVFEAEAGAPNLMRRPPRPPSATPFSRANIASGLLQGSGVAVLLLAGFAAAQSSKLPVAELRPAVFLALVAALYLMVLANRDPARGLRAGLRDGNPWLRHVSLAVAGVLALLVLVAPLRAIMGFGVLTWRTAAVAAALSLACAAWLGVHRMQRDLGH